VKNGLLAANNKKILESLRHAALHPSESSDVISQPRQLGGWTVTKDILGGLAFPGVRRRSYQHYDF
jgi:hypothetical protein